ncbi:MAG: hypothetical protein QOH88_2949 [Verrucomicrobiota bacterium]|jgi:hypothetical protein
MSDGTRRRWDEFDDKRAAIIAVIKYVTSQPPEVGQRCVGDDAYVRQLYEDREIGNIDVPGDVKTLFMPEGEKAKEAKGSVVIELPPRPVNVPNENDLLRYVLCCYNVWAPGTNP